MCVKCSQAFFYKVHLILDEQGWNWVLQQTNIYQFTATCRTGTFASTSESMHQTFLFHLAKQHLEVITGSQHSHLIDCADNN